LRDDHGTYETRVFRSDTRGFTYREVADQRRSRLHRIRRIGRTSTWLSGDHGTLRPSLRHLYSGKKAGETCRAERRVFQSRVDIVSPKIYRGWLESGSGLTWVRHHGRPQKMDGCRLSLLTPAFRLQISERRRRTRIPCPPVLASLFGPPPPPPAPHQPGTGRARLKVGSPKGSVIFRVFSGAQLGGAKEVDSGCREDRTIFPSQP